MPTTTHFLLYSSTILSVIRFTGVLVMMALLAFLTTLNFVLYSPTVLKQKAAIATVTGNSAQSSDFPDEKTPDNPNSFSDEFLHEPEDLTTLSLTSSNRFPVFTITALLSRALSFVSPPPDRA